MLISHMFENDETYFYVPSAGTQVLKGLNSCCAVVCYKIKILTRTGKGFYDNKTVKLDT